jgi:MHS family proline/betaine transporter-like MFS transporter
VTNHRVGRAVAAAAIGNAFEWYDFTVFVLFAPYIAQAFFPGGSETAALVKTFLTFGVGFVARPVGGVLIGYFGDRAGRKAALTLTFALMAVGTLVIGLSPTATMIGEAAPILVLAGRLLQGLSAGGEIGGAAAFLVEHAPIGRRGRFAAWLQASMAISNILGAVVAIAVHEAIPEPALTQWGWRVPFIFGLLIVPVGIWLRTTLEETPEFLAQSAAEHREPVFSALRSQGAMILRGFGLSILWGVSIYALVIFMPVHAQKALGFSAEEAFTASVAGNLVLIGMCFLSGHLADRIGRLKLLAAAALTLLALPPLFMALLMAKHSLAVLIVVQIGFCALAGLYAGAMPATLTELFPIRVRSTGTSIAYNAAFTIFAGFAPVIVTWLATGGIGAQAPTVYVAAAAIVALIAIRSFRKTA